LVPELAQEHPLLGQFVHRRAQKGPFYRCNLHVHAHYFWNSTGMTKSPTNPTAIRPPRSLKRARGAGFQKGHVKTGGRPPGGQNGTSKQVKEMIIAAADGIGGLARLIEWIMEHPRHEERFWCQIWPRLLPLRVQGAVHSEVDLNVKIDPSELMKKLEERGLPQTIFGSDAPDLDQLKVIEHQPNGDAGVTNGSDTTRLSDWSSDQ
jgi:hypothetical protein